MKKIQVTFSDGTVWECDAKRIAESRALYYAELDYPEKGMEYLKTLDDEIEYALSSDDELSDWASNNMNWGDIQFVRVETKKADYKKEWVNVDKVVVGEAE